MIISSRRKRFHRNAFILLTGAIALLLPFTVFGVSIAVILLVLNWLAEGGFRDKIRRIKQNKLILLFMLLFVAYLFGMIHTRDFQNGVFQLEIRLSLFFFPLVIGTSDHMSRRILHGIFTVFLIACTSAAIFSLIYGLYRHLNDYDLAFAHGFFTEPLAFHPAYFAVYIQMCIFICLYFFVLNRSKTGKAAVAGLAVLLFVFMVFLAARMQLVAFAVILSLGLFYYMYKKKKLILGALLVAGVAGVVIGTVILSPSLRARFAPLFDAEQYEIEPGNEYTWNNANLRIAHWIGAWEVITENWLIGTGTGDAQAALNQKYTDRNRVGIEGYNAHNQFLQIWMRLGIIGLLIFVAGLIIPFVKSIRSKQLIFMAFILLFVISGLTESMLCAQKGVVFYAFFNSLMAFTLFKRNQGFGSPI